MTTEKILAELMTYINTLEERDQKFIRQQTVRDEMCTTTGCATDMGLFHLSNAVVALHRNIRAENAKSNGKAKLFQIANKIIKNAPREAFQTAYMIDGKQYVCDTWRAIRINNPIDLPEKPIENKPDLKKIFSGAECNDTELSLPDIGKLKAYIKIERAKQTNRKKHTVEYDFGIDRPSVNAEYLLSIMEAFPDCQTAYCKGINQPLYFPAAEGDALLCPMRKAEKRASV